MIASAPTSQSSRVRPSAGDLATESVPVLPFAPGRFSTITVWPSAFDSGSLIARAMMSDEPPGVYGTMIWIGFDGQAGVCAKAPTPAAQRRGAEQRATEGPQGGPARAATR